MRICWFLVSTDTTSPAICELGGASTAPMASLSVCAAPHPLSTVANARPRKALDFISSSCRYERVGGMHGPDQRVMGNGSPDLWHQKERGDAQGASILLGAAGQNPFCRPGCTGGIDRRAAAICAEVRRAGAGGPGIQTFCGAGARVGPSHRYAVAGEAGRRAAAPEAAPDPQRESPDGWSGRVRMEVLGRMNRTRYARLPIFPRCARLATFRG